MYRLVPFFFGMILLSSCMMERELTYSINEQIDGGEREVIAESFRNWEAVTGVRAVEVSGSKQALINFRESELPPNFTAHADWDYETRLNLETFEIVDVLLTATITVDPTSWHLSRRGKIRMFNHEIAHIIANHGHTTACPSTLHPTPGTCGTMEIDEFAANKANLAIENSWLEFHQTPSIFTLPQ